MGAIKKAIKTITHGVEKAAKGIGHFAKAAATLDLKGMAKGLKEIGQAGAEIARGAINLTPAAMAANTLLNGALDKILQKAEKLANKVSDTLVDNFEQGLSNVKNGVIGTVKGIAHGNLGEALDGIKKTAMGAIDVASNFGPGGVAKNLARMAVDTAVGMAAEKTTEVVAKKLDPHGTSVLGGLAAEMAGAAVGGAVGAGRTGRGAGADLKNAGRTGANDATQIALDTATQQATERLHTLLGTGGASQGGGSTFNPTLGDGEGTSRTKTRHQQQHHRHVDGGAKPHGTSHVSPLRQAVENVVQQALLLALPIAIEAAIQKAIHSMSPDSAKALASLGQALELAGGGSANPQRNSAVRGLRQELSNAIEMISLMAMEKAIAKVADGAMQLGAAMGPNAKSPDGLQQLLSSSLKTEVQHLSDAITKAVTDIAGKALALGMLSAAMSTAVPTQPLPHISIEVGLRV